jgi:hypothetical protein
VPRLEARLDTLRSGAARLRVEADSLDALVRAMSRRPASDAADTATSAALTRALAATRTRIAARDSALQRTETDRDAARTLTRNLDAFGDAFLELFFLSFVIGILMAQVSGAAFYKLLYGWLGTRPKDFPGETYLRLRAAPDKATEFIDLLETKNFRYLEVAMNMVLPTAALGVALLAVARTGPRGPAALPPAFLIALAIFCLVAAVALCVTGLDMYNNYRQRRREIHLALAAEHLKTGAKPDQDLENAAGVLKPVAAGR